MLILTVNQIKIRHQWNQYSTVLYRFSSQVRSSLRSACEVLRVSELQVEAEQQVQRLDPAVVDGDVQQAADDVGVLSQAALQAGRRQLQAAQQLLQLGRPLLHQAVDVGHRSAVLNAGRRFGAMQGADALHPAVHGPRVCLRTGDARHFLQLEEGRFVLQD